MRVFIGLLIGLILGDIDIDNRRIGCGALGELGLKRLQQPIEIVHPLAMLGRDRHRLAKAKAPGVDHPDLARAALGLVDAQDHPGALAPQDIGEDLIRGGEAHASVDQEQRDIGHIDRTLGQSPHPALQAVVSNLFQAGGVDHGEPQIEQPGIALAQIPGNTGLVIDQSQLPANQPVEQRGLAHVGSSDDGEGKGHLPLPENSKGVPLHAIGVNGKPEVVLRR